MPKKFSKTTGGFYDPAVHSEEQMPGDCVDLSDEEYEQIFAAQSRGAMISGGVDGRPIAVKPVPSVPQVVSMRQARLALLAAGQLALVATAIDALPSPQKERAQIEWEFAATVERSSSLVDMLARALGLDDGQLDGLFTSAAAL